MADEPSPPPEDAEGAADEAEPYPFVETIANGGPDVQVLAGWANPETGDPVGQPVVNHTGHVASTATEKAAETALAWYSETIMTMIRQSEEQAGD